MNKLKFIILCLVLNILSTFGAHPYKESYYQKEWCDKWQGIMEYRLNDETRVDCLTKNYAVEFDFAPKWAESIGQSLYYAQETGKKPAIVLIIENDGDYKYYTRAKKLAQNYDIQLWYMKMPEIIITSTVKKYEVNNHVMIVIDILRQLINNILTVLGFN